MTFFSWKVPGRIETLTAMYATEATPGEIAAALGEGATAKKVGRKAWELGLAGQRDDATVRRMQAQSRAKARAEGRSRSNVGPNRFDWSVGDRMAVFRQAYLEEGLSPDQVARRIGGGCTGRMVIKKASNSGLSKLRNPAVTARLRAENTRLSNYARAARRAESRPPTVVTSFRKPAPTGALGEGRGLPEDVKAAIEAAIAEGKVTVLPPGVACGLTSYERMFGAARPQHVLDPKDAEAKARGLRGGRATIMSRANGKRFV